VLDDLPTGWTTRAPEASDAEAVTALILACDLQVMGHSDATVEQTAADIGAPGYDRERGGVLVHDATGELVGFLWTQDEPESASVFVDPYALDPDLTDWLLRRGMAYVRGLARERGTTVAAKAGSYDHDSDLTGALERAGLTVRRTFWRMRIDLDGREWPAPVPPNGIVLRNPDPAQDATYVELHALVSDFFADHYDFTAREYPAWRAHFEASAGQDPTQWWVADVDGTPAAVLIGDESRAELGMGWVRTLGVLAPYRGRGLGRLLLRTAFAQAAARGRTSVGLGVDSENTTGATALYESVGMWPESVLLAWRGDVTP
jgi:mycothiol synthase